MKCKLLYVPTVLAVISVLGQVLAGPELEPTAQWTTRRTTAGHRGQDLTGKMFTLSMNRGGVSFFSPSFQPFYTTTRPYNTYPSWTTTRPYTATRPYTTYPPWTTASPFAGVSVCLRYLTDFIQMNTPKIFTLSPSSRSPLIVSASRNLYTINFDRYEYYRLSFTPSIPLWSADRDTWTRLCLTVDNKKNVAQVFSGLGMSIRKRLPFPFVWSGEPVIDFPGFDGQVTDVQVWDYPLSYREVFNYMNPRRFNPSTGSVLTWSYISYSLTGDTLVEDTYQWQAKQPISHRGRGRQPPEEKMKMVFFLGESRKGKRQPLK